MTTDVKLLPLPINPFGGGVSAAELREWCRANMAELLAENERLRGEWLKALGLSMQAQAEAKDLRGACDVYQAHAERLAQALRLALDSHGVMLMTDPPQDAWKAYGVEAKARAALDQEGGNG